MSDKEEYYIVVKENTLKFNVGQKVKLKDSLARALSGKVVLASQYGTVTANQKKLIEVESEAKALQEENDSLKLQLKALELRIAELSGQGDSKPDAKEQEK